MRIRRLEAAELELVAPIWASLLAHHGEVEPELRSRPAAESWPMRRDDYERWLAEPNSFATLAVLPARRGAGIGAALMDAVEEELHRLGIEDMWVAVVARNSDALRFYERRGLRTYMHRMHTRLRVDSDG